MESLGFKWTPTMQIGSGCKVHLAAGELPMGRLVVSVSKHYTAVIDGVVHDTYDPQREESHEIWTRPYGYELRDDEEQIDRDAPAGTVTIARRIGGRCVYGYWTYAPDA